MVDNLYPRAITFPSWTITQPMGTSPIASAFFACLIASFILDILIDFVQDENHSVLVSSHIISDLEKVADYITFIHKGKLVFTHSKDELVDNYGVMSCGAMVFDNLDKSEIIAYRKEDYQYKVLVKDRHIAEKKYPKAIVVPAAIEEIMLFYVKGEMK